MREEVVHWWKQAKDDLDTAKSTFEIKKYHVSVFYCQQAVEKGLKAYFLKKKKTSSGLTHSLIYLASAVKMPKRFLNG